MENKQSSAKKKFFDELDKLAVIEFDYEVAKLVVEKEQGLISKMYFFDKNTKQNRIVNYSNFFDALYEVKEVRSTSLYNAGCLKRLVSKKKRRFQNENFDLDLMYVTKRVLAMGFPSSGFESLYRNSVNDVTNFFHSYHNNNVKVFNLCLEKDRIYPKTLFPLNQVGLFPSKDHNPCPIKLILDFCVDICLYLINNPSGIAAVHCKAGKGRTGVMICCYLIFSGLCKNSDDALEHYAKTRTLNGRGVTIPSQKRYIKYFEDFLTTNYSPPYVNMIPKIMKYNININTSNIIKNFEEDSTYFYAPNYFMLKEVKIGPFTSEKKLKLTINDFLSQAVDLGEVLNKSEKVDKYFYHVTEFKSVIRINTDVKINVEGVGVKFYLWFNFWYSTWNILKDFMSRSKNGNRPEEEKEAENISAQGKEPGHKNHMSNTSNHKLLEAKTRDNSPEIEMKNVNNGNSANSANSHHPRTKSQEAEQLIKENEEGIKRKSDDFISYNDGIREMRHEANFGGIHGQEEESKIDTVEENLYNLVAKLDNNTDLNSVINLLNRQMSQIGKATLNKENLSITLYKEELDKFDNCKKMEADFSVEIKFSLIN